MVAGFVDTDAGYCAIWLQIGDRSHDDPRVLCRSVNVKMFGTTDSVAVTQLHRLQSVW
jgi:hypothetical protein